MVRVHQVVILVVGALAWGTAIAASSLSPAQVLNVGGIPCFFVDAGHHNKQLELAAIEVTAEPNELVWESHSAAENRAPVLETERNYLLYGRNVDGNVQSAPAKLLAPGYRYRVWINADVVCGRAVKNRQYTGRFCMVRELEGIRPVQVPFDEATGDWHWNICSSTGRK